MKPYITSDQLNELSDESYSKLAAFVCDEGVGADELDAEDLDTSTLMNFIHCSGLVEGFHIYYLRSEEGGEWGMEVKLAEDVAKYKEKEYIDLLWQAVKELLEQNLN